MIKMNQPSADIFYRIPFADTDQMGVVYYANFLIYFEMARAELMRSLGLPYSKFEELGFGLPVLEAHCFYHKPAKFEDFITITATVLELKGVRLKVGCTVKRGEELLADGYTLHAVIGKDGRPIRPPVELLNAISGNSCEKDAGQ